jgi:hypothetical protein
MRGQRGLRLGQISLTKEMGFGVGPETYSLAYGARLAAIVPGFVLLAIGFGPETLSPAAFGAAWAVGSVLILAAVLHHLRKVGQPFAPR